MSKEGGKIWVGLVLIFVFMGISGFYRRGSSDIPLPGQYWMARREAKFHIQHNEGELLAKRWFQLAHIGNINGIWLEVRRI